jgi:hypothetical protein
MVVVEDAAEPLSTLKGSIKRRDLCRRLTPLIGPIRLDDAGNPGVDNEETDDDGDGEWECQGDCDDTDILNFAANTEDCSDFSDNDCDGAIDDADLLDCGANGLPEVGSATGCAIGAQAVGPSYCVIGVGNPDPTHPNNISPGVIVDLAITVTTNHGAVGDLFLSISKSDLPFEVTLISAGVCSGDLANTVFCDGCSSTIAMGIPWCPKTRSRSPSIIQRSRVSCRLMAEERG